MVLLKRSHGQDDLQRRPQSLNVRFPPQPSTTTSPEGILYLSKNSNATCLNCCKGSRYFTLHTISNVLGNFPAAKSCLSWDLM